MPFREVHTIELEQSSSMNPLLGRVSRGVLGAIAGVVGVHIERHRDAGG
jgi:hypothetical protein